jgi:tetratricopeptide (TPR) repeat protein/2-polyprenyl-3-methyl-5-hydroxy-6-metoxy-1,4-benzoquinol methylase
MNLPTALAMIDEGNALEEQGRIDEAMARYDAAAEVEPRCARAHLNRGNVLLARSQIDESRHAYQFAITCDPHYAAAHFNLGNLNYRVGDFELALRNYQAAIDIKPDFADAFVAMANALDNLGRVAEAVQSYERALTIIPNYAEVHFSLGVLAIARGRRAEAVQRLRRAVESRPDFVQAHRALATVLTELEDLDAAAVSLRQILTLRPESEDIPYELAMILSVLGQFVEALRLLLPVLERGPTWEIKAIFFHCAAHARFTSNDPRIRTALTNAISQPWGTPYLLCRPTFSFIMLDRRIAHCVHLANGSWPARLPKSILFGAFGLAALETDSLLHALLQAAPVSTPELERFLTCARFALLEIASDKEAADISEITALRFYSALSQQCFVNEYIFDIDSDEQLAAEACRTKLLALLDARAVIPPLLVLVVAAYYPLYTLEGARRLLDVNFPAPVDAVLRQQIIEPLEEEALRVGIERLTPITVGVSQDVRSQYEQNPYPRWVRMPVLPNALRFNDELRRSVPFGPFTPLTDDVTPEVLIAGCGTGNHSIFAAQRYRDVRVLAIDLSLSSISYAKRKTQELGMTNIQYGQADILKIGELSRTFDIIESVGVLHHLADPFNGWRILLSRLRPGGFMRLGFYSQLARRHVVKARELIATCGYKGTIDDIRRFRQDLTRHQGIELQGLGQYPDFYSTSQCRDLLFHVQEHRLTLEQIESFLAEHALNFLGFECDGTVLNQYRKRFADDPYCTNLRKWASFEADNPDLFIGMYQFWIQKPISGGDALHVARVTSDG